MTNIVEVSNLTKDYGYGRGVFNVSFSIKKSEAFGFLGPNGAGKSTTVRQLMGFSKPQRGTTKIFGKDTFKNYNKILRRVGYIPGELALPAGLTGYEFIKMIQDLDHVYNNDRLSRLCSMFKLEDNILKMNTKQMSLGTKRKLVIITAFMSDPEILILDEPSSGLDPFMQDVFINFIKEEKKRGKTILLSSHLFNEVEQTCDRISIIKDGKIVSTFITNDLKHDKNKFYIVAFDNQNDYRDFLNEVSAVSYLKIVDYKNDKNKVFISTNDENIKEVVSLLSKYRITEFTNKKETLEDYFLKFYQEDKDFGEIKL
ncbi:MAG: ABC transporter ATP-binding protein [Bacilli bacterium]|nr:ABC transporter ATP-binding protein [Bacilli bacterium]